MGIRNDSQMTPLRQGKFIHELDRRAFEIRARTLQADAVRQAAQAIGETIGGWFARHLAPGRHRTIRVRAG
jgi:hypothetical protein